MNAKVKRISSILLMSIMLCCGAACNKNESISNETTYNDTTYTTTKQGTHINEVSDGSGYIVENGVSDYKIVIAEGDTSLLWAAQEVQSYVKLSTGCELKIINDSLVEDYGQNSKYIFIGNNKFLDDAGVSYTLAELGTNGFKIKSVGTNIFLGGYYLRGTKYAVFELLYHLVGFEQFTINACYYETLTSIPTKTMNIIELPDYEWRQCGNGSFSEQALYALKLNTESEIWMTNGKDENGTTTYTPYVHNSFTYLPAGTYRADHPLWYASSGQQLCFTAGGDEAEYSLMVDTVFEKMKNIVVNNPTMNVITFIQQDNSSFCQCSACKSEEEKYGTNTAAIVKFVNALGRKLKAWIAEGEEVPQDRDVTLCMMAYQAAVAAPVKEDENGNYVPVDDDVIFEDNVGLWYAPIDMDFSKRITDPANEWYYENTEKWFTLTDKTFLWLYQTNFQNYLIPRATWGTYQELYRYFYDKGAKVMYHQGQYNNQGTTAFNELKIYLSSKFAWNVNYDEAELTRNFFEKVYGSAAGTMRMFLDEVIANSEYFEKLDLNVYTPDEELPYEAIKRWINYFEVAYSQLEASKSNNVFYDQQVRMVKLESIFPRYINVTYYNEEYPLNTLNNLRRSFVEDTAALRVQYCKEWETMASITGQWQF